jgi:hypothetical protein
MQIDVENAFNNVFRVTILKKLCDAKRPLVNIVPFTTLFYDDHFSFTTSMGNMERVIFRHEAR